MKSMTRAASKGKKQIAGPIKVLILFTIVF